MFLVTAATSRESTLAMASSLEMTVTTVSTSSALSCSAPALPPNIRLMGSNNRDRLRAKYAFSNCDSDSRRPSSISSLNMTWSMVSVLVSISKWTLLRMYWLLVYFNLFHSSTYSLTNFGYSPSNVCLTKFDLACASNKPQAVFLVSSRCSSRSWDMWPWTASRARSMLAHSEEQNAALLPDTGSAALPGPVSCRGLAPAPASASVILLMSRHSVHCVLSLCCISATVVPSTEARVPRL